jgi:hypothetical protein
MSPIRALAAASKFARLIASANKGVKLAETFHEEIVENVPRIREVVNSGQRTFDEVADLIERAAKFKHWVRGKDSSESLRRDYIRDVSHTELADKLPPRAVRMLVMTGAGIALSAVTGPISGGLGALALNSADYFLIDRLVKAGGRASSLRVH